MKNIKEVYIEHPVVVDPYNFRGLIDMMVIAEDDSVYIYDIKTINAWSYRMKFGRAKENNPSIHQELQLATYGIWALDTYGRLDGMYLLYYNKDSSMLKEQEVSMDRIDTARAYWENVIRVHDNGLPVLTENESPVMDWECKYCNFKEQCDKEQ
tara:strand:+ start:516 stop:977 length:462 start_codon:yes stop_codon:yes gene_type:complete